MAVRKEWMCAAHGPFESTKPKCPHGCNTVTRVFLTAPSIHTSGRRQNIDNTLETLAAHHNLTNLSNRNGSIASSIRMYDANGLQAGWAPMGKNPVETVKSMHFETDNALDRVKEATAFKPPIPADGSRIDLKYKDALKGVK